VNEPTNVYHEFRDRPIGRSAVGKRLSEEEARELTKDLALGDEYIGTEGHSLRQYLNLSSGVTVWISGDFRGWT
jgi:hypothetical protein